jgi:hypothetical protein
MTKKQQQFRPIFVKAIDLLKKDASTDNRQVRVLTANDVDLQEWQADDEQ